MLKFLIVFTGFCLAMSQGYLAENNYRTCSILGVTHSRTFATESTVDACFQTGTRVLVDNMYFRITTHTYLDESSMLIDWSSTKVYVEFYGDIPQVPIALFSSDILQCDCARPCLAQRFNGTQLGVSGVVTLYVREENGTSVAYLNYTLADVTISIRRTEQGYFINVVVPERIAYASSGFCTVGCPRVNDHQSLPCFNGDYIRPPVDICESALIELNDQYVKSDYLHDLWTVPCSHDVLLWGNASAALYHRYSFADWILISNWSLICTLYPQMYRPYSLSWIQYDPIINQILDQCSALNTTVNASVVSLNSTARLTTVIDLSPPVQNSSDIKIDLTNDRFVDISGLKPVVLPVVRPVVQTIVTPVSRLSSIVNSKAPLRVDFAIQPPVLQVPNVTARNGF